MVAASMSLWLLVSLWPLWKETWKKPLHHFSEGSPARSEAMSLLHIVTSRQEMGTATLPIFLCPALQALKIEQHHPFIQQRLCAI